MNPIQTGGVAIGAAALASIITWLSHWPITAPPPDVTFSLAAILVTAGHAAGAFIMAMFPKAAPALQAAERAAEKAAEGAQTQAVVWPAPASAQSPAKS